MKTTLAIIAVAIFGAAAHPIATTIDTRSVRSTPQVAYAVTAAEATDNAWNGNWQGTTVSGSPLVLQIQVQGQKMRGKLIVGKQSADIVEGKIVGIAFALTTKPIDGHPVDATGRRVGESLELTIEGVKEPLTLTRRS